MYLAKQYVYLEICTFLYIQATPLSLQWMKPLAWIVRLLFWAGQKQSTSMSVVNANLWWCCCAMDAEPWNKRVCQHSVLPYLSSCNQYRMSISRTRRYMLALLCGGPMPTYIDCPVSLVQYVCISSLLCLPSVYCAYSYTEWPMQSSMHAST